MRELVKHEASFNTFLAKQWMNGVCALAVLSALSAPVTAAEDADRPTVWIELGGQVERFDGGQSYFTPPFSNSFVGNGFTPVENIQRPSRYGNGFEGKVVFAPEASNWTVSASIRYGRSNAQRRSHEETSPLPTYTGFVSVPLFHIHAPVYVNPNSNRFGDSTAKTDEQSAILDFEAGRDLGIGLFGDSSRSHLDFGLRAAQFTASARGTIGSNPDFHMTAFPVTTFAGFPANGTAFNAYFHLYKASFDLSRSFKGIGPSLAWQSTEVLLRPSDTWALTADWGVNGAVLFGKQKVAVHHQVSAVYQTNVAIGTGGYAVPVYNTSRAIARSRSVVIPNLGAFAGVSLQLPNAKVSFGYRADFFFGAMDGGIDTRKTYDRNFYGPFATISIGLGG